MTRPISERAFEDAIEAALLQHGPDAVPGTPGKVAEDPPPYDDPGMRPGGYHKRRPEDYDRTLCLLPGDVLDFLLATQPKQWRRLSQHHGAEVRERFLKRLSLEIERRGALDILRRGVKDMGCSFRLAYFRPASGLNEETRRLHAANFFAVARQIRYSARNEKSLDMVLFLNGIPIFTAELKNPLTGQTVEDAIRQYKTDRDPREPLLAYGRCLAHFAVDPELVYVTTHLAGPKSRFLPFNQGRFGGAGNPPVPPTRDGYATAYLWEEIEESGAETPEEVLENAILAEMEKRGPLPNLSTFAFTATPKPKTLELFGMRRPGGSFAPFHLYSMRQAIEEGFILDVLASYTTCKAYWRLWKTVEDDPRYERKKAAWLLRSFVELHRHAIDAKVRIMVEHFAEHVQGRIGGRAKAMIVTRSRLHAVRYKLAVDACLAEQGHPFKALVAFSGAVNDGGPPYTETGMNGIPETQTARTFEGPNYRFLIVANKFQTGFDQPLLHTMYVDKKLGGVNAVQTLSRLNRTHPEKRDTMVLDFANDADDIKAAFEPYYETTLLSEATDPNLLYEIQSRLEAFPVYAQSDVDGFARVFFDSKVKQDRLYAVLDPIVRRFGDLQEDERQGFRGLLTDYVRLYAFLAQVLTFADAELEKLYVFARHLRRLLPADRQELPIEVQQNIDMESYRIRETRSGRVALDRRAGVLDPVGSKGAHGPQPDEIETLSKIIAELNERFGLDLGPEHRVTLGQMMERLDGDAALDAAARVNTRENVRLTFDHKVEQVIQEIVDSNFDLYKRITDDRSFGEVIKDVLFDQYLRGHRNAEELIKQGESKTLEFKSTLRWNLKEDRRDDKRVTHAALKTIAAFLNTEGGDLLLGVADDGAVIGVERDGLDNDDKFMRHLAQVVRNGLGDRAGTCIDPKMQIVDGKGVCVVSCRRSPEPVFLTWKGVEKAKEGDFFVRSGPGTVKLSPDDTKEYVRTRFAEPGVK